MSSKEGSWHSYFFASTQAIELFMFMQLSTGNSNPAKHPSILQIVSQPFISCLISEAMAEYIECSLHLDSNFEMQADVAFNISQLYFFCRVPGSMPYSATHFPKAWISQSGVMAPGLISSVHAIVNAA